MLLKNLGGAWLAYLVLCALAAFGLSHLSFNDGLAKSFESDTPQYRQYEQFLSQFSTGENEIFVVFEGQDFANPRDLEQLSDFLLELQFEDAVTAAISPFALSSPDQPGALLIPAELGTQAEMSARFAAAHADDPALERLLSLDRKTMLAVLITSAQTDTPDQRRALYDQIQTLADDTLDPDAITATITGYGVLMDTVAKKLTDDFLLLNIIGLAAGTLISMLALRSLKMALIVAASAVTALLWVLGAMGFAGVEITVVTVALPVLVLVLSYANALHLGFELRYQRQEADGGSYVRTALRRIGPASVLSALTTAIAFASLMFSSSALISQLGLAGAFSTVLSTIAVYFVLPLFMLSVDKMARTHRSTAYGAHSFTSNFSLAPLITGAVRHHRLVTVLSLVILMSGLAIYNTARPVFTLFENSTPQDPARQALERIEQDLVPIGAVAFTHPIAPADRLQNAQTALKDIVGARNLLTGAAFPTPADDPDAPAFFTSRQGDTALMLVSHAYTGAAQTRLFLDQLGKDIAADPRLAQLSAPTGMLAVSSLISQDMLADFTACFLIAVLCSGLVIAIWLRSPVMGALAMIPNVLPIALVGAWLALSGSGLQFTSGVAMTIAFGLAIDNSVHVLNRMNLNGARGIRYTVQQIIDSTRQVAPVLVISTLVLSFGISGTLSASLPQIAYFGQLSIAVFVLALVTDVVVFPACLMSLHRGLGRWVKGDGL
ncbi:MAG: RND family transporter [Sedimentitalea sp.]